MTIPVVLPHLYPSVHMELTQEDAVDITPEVRDVLREAKGLVARAWFGAAVDGLLTMVGEHPRHCALTAIAEASSRSYLMTPACRALEEALGLSLDGVLTPIPKWNNAPERTHEEVVAAFDLALGIKPQKTAPSTTKITEEVYA